MQDISILRFEVIFDVKMDESLRILGYTKTNHMYPLDHKWLYDSFYRSARAFYDTVMTKKDGSFKCPISASLDEKQFKGVKFPKTGPKMKYKQDDLDACAVFSLASALYTSGDDLMQKFIRSKLDDCLQGTRSVMISLGVFMTEGDKNKETKRIKKYQRTKMKGEKCNFHGLSEINLTILD